MKIAFVADIHLPKLGEKARGVDTFKNFDKFLADVKSQNADHIIVGGDISFKEPDIIANQYVFDKISLLKTPFSIVSGNHDRTSELIKSFRITDIEDELYYVKQIKDQHFIFMDSSKGEISEKQMIWLDNTLISRPKINTIFIHHPIVNAKVPYMDNNHALKNMYSIQSIVEGQDRIITVVSGHYHVEKVIHTNNIIQLITPSLFMQIDQTSESFIVDHYIPGYRILEYENGKMMSTVRYLD